MQLRPRELTALLTECIKARRPVLVTGAPGVGKTQLILAAAKAAGAGVLVSHPAVEDPTTPGGLPWASPGDEHARFLPFGVLYQALTATRPTVWVLDDLGQASPAVQAAYMQLLLGRRVGEHALPDCVTFVAATNRRQDRAGVGGILEPVKSRFVTIVELAAHIDDWAAWALDADLPPVLVAFLRFRPDLLSDFQPTADMANSPSPRGWESVGAILRMDLPQNVQHVALAGAVGAGAATELVAFIRMYQELPNVDAILVDPDAAPLPTQPAALYAVSTALAARATPTNFERVARYVSRLEQDGRGEFSALVVRDAIRRTPEVQSTTAFVRLVSGPLGDLFNGSH